MMPERLRVILPNRRSLRALGVLLSSFLLSAVAARPVPTVVEVSVGHPNMVIIIDESRDQLGKSGLFVNEALHFCKSDQNGRCTLENGPMDLTLGQTIYISAYGNNRLLDMQDRQVNGVGDTLVLDMLDDNKIRVVGVDEEVACRPPTGAICERKMRDRIILLFRHRDCDRAIVQLNLYLRRFPLEVPPKNAAIAIPARWDRVVEVLYVLTECGRYASNRSWFEQAVQIFNDFDDPEILCEPMGASDIATAFTGLKDWKQGADRFSRAQKICDKEASYVPFEWYLYFLVASQDIAGFEEEMEREDVSDQMKRFMAAWLAGAQAGASAGARPPSCSAGNGLLKRHIHPPCRALPMSFCHVKAGDFYFFCGEKELHFQRAEAHYAKALAAGAFSDSWKSLAVRRVESSFLGKQDAALELAKKYIIEEGEAPRSLFFSLAESLVARDVERRDLSQVEELVEAVRNSGELYGCEKFVLRNYLASIPFRFALSSAVGEERKALLHRAESILAGDLNLTGKVDSPPDMKEKGELITLYNMSYIALQLASSEDPSWGSRIRQLRTATGLVEGLVRSGEAEPIDEYLFVSRKTLRKIGETRCEP